MWVVAFGTCISAFFILAANAWMQHPVGYELNPETDRAELIDFFALMTNITAWSHFGTRSWRRSRPAGCS